MNEPLAQWVGWVWRWGRWHRDCQAETLAACSRQLGEQARRSSVRDRDTIMTAGNVPSIVPPGTHRIAQDEAVDAGSVRSIR
jgi:hypothetical protein